MEMCGADTEQGAFLFFFLFFLFFFTLSFSELCVCVCVAVRVWLCVCLCVVGKKNWVSLEWGAVNGRVEFGDAYAGHAVSTKEKKNGVVAPAAGADRKIKNKKKQTKEKVVPFLVGRPDASAKMRSTRSQSFIFFLFQEISEALFSFLVFCFFFLSTERFVMNHLQRWIKPQTDLTLADKKKLEKIERRSVRRLEACQYLSNNYFVSWFIFKTRLGDEDETDVFCLFFLFVFFCL